MKIAVFGNVHGRLDALEAVLKDVEIRGLEGLIHLGDLWGAGPDPAAVVERVRVLDFPGVVGDEDLAALARGDVPSQHRQFLEALPAQLRIEEGGRTFLFTHGSPESPTEALDDGTDEDRLEVLFDGTGADVLVTGQAPCPGARAVGERLLVRPGWVAGDPPSYCIVDTGRGLEVAHVRVAIPH